MFPVSWFFARRVPAWAFICAVAVILPACGGGGGGGGTADASPEPVASLDDTEATGEAAAANLAEGTASDASDNTVPDTGLPDVAPAAAAVPTVPSVLPPAGKAARGALGGSYGVDLCACRS